ncbi:MAG: DEAD/DEAH box helicase [Candidatus Sumerlaeia bacterium]|nr:DEAD/DEAH box helicase [Candidatus Sumerlaeia bacterium]
MTFETLRIDVRCQKVLRERGIATPTPIQAQAIPVALTGSDLVAIAQTGTGKTLAFGLPALTRLAGLPRGTTGMVVLAPTRELVQQVHDVLAPIARALGLTTACIYGGVGMQPQTDALRRGASIVIACPGRLLDHMARRNTRFENVSILVLDEADRMLDMGFLPDIRRVLAGLPTERQTMMFSATFPPEIAGLADAMMRHPERVEVGPVARPVDTVRQGVFNVAREEKVDLLKHLLAQDHVGPTIVFARTKRGTDRLARILTTAGFAAESLHGGHSQNQRTRAINGFRNGRHRILVATDVAARGLDVKGISHVVNYDIPVVPEDYIHRIGRTARAQATGEAITFVTPDDTVALRDIERTLGKRLDRQDWGNAPRTHTPAHLSQPAPRRSQSTSRPADRSAGPAAASRRPRPARVHAVAPSRDERTSR